MVYCTDQFQLSREEEGETGPDTEVTKEDQDKINSFSRLHNRERILEEELQGKLVRQAPHSSLSALSHNHLFLSLGLLDGLLQLTFFDTV